MRSKKLSPRGAPVLIAGQFVTLALFIFFTFLARPGFCISSDANTLLLLHFENSLTGVAGETPTVASGVTYEAGISGSGAYFSNNNFVTYATSNNINATNGTLEFWINPRWNGDDGQTYEFLVWGGAGGLLFAKDGANNLRSIFNRYQSESGVYINVSGLFVANQWHHVAYTWNSSAIKLYLDGVLKTQAPAPNLPLISASTFQIGAEGFSSPANAVIDELRISDRERTATEIAQSYLADISVTGLSVFPTSTNLLQTWWHTPALTATTSIGAVSIPSYAATWTSANTNVAIVDATGKVIAIGPGSTTLTAMFNGQSAVLTVNVTAPVRASETDVIDPYLSTPATNALYDMPVVIINYIPTPDGTNTDDSILGTYTVSAFKSNLTVFNKRIKFMLEQGSRYHGYTNANARASLGYRVVKIVTAYEVLPPGKPAGNDFFPNYLQILDRFGVGGAVSNQNVKEVWLWGYQTAGIVPAESDMSSPTTGDISNSDRDNTDLPVYDRTFVLYNYNSTRTQAEAVHNHGHQLESILGYINQRQDGNTDLFWQKFVGLDNNGVFQKGRCGDTHFPPNGASDYDYDDSTFALSDCLDWNPADTGQMSYVNSSTWGDLNYAWPDAVLPPQQTESQYYMFWMQNMPGWQNGIRYTTNVMANWWEFTADWDHAVLANHGLYHQPKVSFVNSTRSSTNFATVLSGDAGFNYAIEGATNFTAWTNLITVTNFTGFLPFQDAAILPRRFYRARQLTN